MKNLIVIMLSLFVFNVLATPLNLNVRCFEESAEKCHRSVKQELRSQYCSLQSDIHCTEENGSSLCKVVSRNCNDVKDDGNGTSCSNGGEKTKFKNKHLNANFIGKMFGGEFKYAVKHFCKYYTY